MTLNEISQIAQIIIAIGTLATAYYAFSTSKKTTEIFSKQLKLDFFQIIQKDIKRLVLIFQKV